MCVQRKMGFIIMIIIMVIGQLLGEIKAVGRILIPTANGEKPFKCLMVITPTGIEVECALKIFQPFNLFDAPKQAKIMVNTAEIEDIQVQIQENKIYIITTDSFCIRHRNIFNRAYKVIGFECLSPVTIENWALIFTLDNHADIEAVGEALIKIIGKRCEVLRD